MQAILFSNLMSIKYIYKIGVRYFKPKKVQQLGSNWGQKEKELLVEAIGEFGIGKWQLMKAKYVLLAKHDLRAKAMRLLGRQDLGEYNGMKFSAEDVEREYRRNQEIGKQLGAWKNGMLVADEAGQVQKRIAETHHTCIATAEQKNKDEPSKATTATKSSSSTQPNKKRKIAIKEPINETTEPPVEELKSPPVLPVIENDELFGEIQENLNEMLANN